VLGCRLGVGIVGAGFIGQIHARAARLAGANLIGITDATPERSAAAAVELGAEREFTEAAELIAHPSVGVVHVCTPNYSHLEFVEMALAAGKHVICEKPLAMTVDEAARLTDMARSRHMVAAVPFAYCYEPRVVEARERTLRGQLGHVHLIHGSYLQDWLLFPSDGNWRVDPGQGGASRAFADIGSHWCHLAEWITGQRIAELVATTTVAVSRRASPWNGTFEHASASRVGDRRLSDVTTEDIACLVFRTSEDAVGTLTVSQVSAGRKNRLWIEVDGSDSSLTFNEEHPESLWIGRRSGTECLPRDPAVLTDEARRLTFLPPGHSQGFVDNFVGFLSDVYAAVCTSSGRPLDDDCEVPCDDARFPTFADGLRTARITEAVLRSAAEHSWVTVES
jgi:predicted dehydrogenase